MASTGRFGSPITHKRLNFAESNAKVSVELRQQQLQLEKEITRLEKQARTATTNIANYQQSLKNTYRKLERQRREAQVKDRERKAMEGAGKSRKGLMFSTSIKLGVESEDQDDPNASTSSLGKLEDCGGGASDVAPGTEREVSLQKRRSAYGSTRNRSNPEDGSPEPQLLQTHATDSPYISSPYSVRRPSSEDSYVRPRAGSLVVGGVSPLARSKHSSLRRGSQPLTKQRAVENQLAVPITTQTQSMVELEAKVQHMPLGSKSTAQMGSPGVKMKSNPVVKLPPISVPESKSVVDIPSSSFNKKTLLKAAQAMNFKAGSKSHGPQAFGRFYDPLLAPSIVFTTPNTKEKSPSASNQEMDALASEQLTEEERENVSNKEVRNEAELPC